MGKEQWQTSYLSDDGRMHPISTAVAKAICRERTVCVLGYGISNRPLVRLLGALGARVCVYDQKTADALGEQALADAATGVTFVHTDDDWLALHPAVVFRSPGIRPDTTAILRALEAGAVLGSEMEWFLERTAATVIGITGSDGKSTTTTLTAKMLEAQCESVGRGRVFLGGNLGTPLLDRMHEMSADDFAVVELSSFQLSTPMRTPCRAAITNITPNHLNWHTDMEEYTAAKQNICDVSRTRLVTNAHNERTQKIAEAYMAAGGQAVLFALDGAIFPSWAKDTVCCEGGVVTYRCADGRVLDILPREELLLPGDHNVENFMTACALVMGYADPAAMAAVGRTFGGVEHRLQRIRTLDGVTFYNSSIDSSPTRTAAALSALPKRSSVVICGGYDKNIPFDALAQVLCARAGAVVLTGATRHKIMAALCEHPDYDAAMLRVEIRPDFAEAVHCAAKLAWEGCGQNVLLSPACASFDAFVNFEARGRAFCALVASLENKKETESNERK